MTDRLYAMPRFEVRSHQPMAEVFSWSRRPDEKWRFVDSAGHGHFWQDGYPTLRWHPEPCTMGHGLDECDAEGEWRCSICDEAISPKTVAPPPWPEHVPFGPREHVITATLPTGEGVELPCVGNEVTRVLVAGIKAMIAEHRAMVADR